MAGGRPPGSKSSKTIQWEQFADWFMTKGMDRLRDEMNKLEGKEFIMTTKDLLEYFQPKLARQEHTGKDGEPLQINWSNADNNTLQAPINISIIDPSTAPVEDYCSPPQIGEDSSGNQ